MMEVRHNLPYDKIGSFRRRDPYIIAYIYPHPSFGKPFIIKGGGTKIGPLIKKELGITPAIVHNTYWYRGNVRYTSIELYNIKNICISEVWDDVKEKYLKKWKIEVRGKNYERKILKNIKRIPRKWIKELEPYMTTVIPTTIRPR